jgi:anti-sigma-K factor RskA
VLQTIPLAGTETAPQATGLIVISADGEHGTLVADGLATLGQDQQYQLWLIKDGERTSGGVFSVNQEGYGSLWVESPQPLSSYSAFGITIEPAGGSPGPTGNKVLGSTL